MLESDKVLALFGKLEYSDRAVIVYLDSITEWLVEVDTGSAVDDDL